MWSDLKKRYQNNAYLGRIASEGMGWKLTEMEIYGNILVIRDCPMT